MMLSHASPATHSNQTHSSEEVPAEACADCSRVTILNPICAFPVGHMGAVEGSMGPGTKQCLLLLHAKLDCVTFRSGQVIDLTVWSGLKLTSCRVCAETPFFMEGICHFSTLGYF